MDSSSSRPTTVSVPSSVQAHAAALAGSSAETPIRVVVESSDGFMARWFLWGGWTAFAFCFVALIGMVAAFQSYFDTSGGLTERHHSGAKFASSKIAIIEITGVIGAGDGFVKRQIDRIRDDANVKGVVVRIDSPGGTITGSDYLFHHLKRLRDEKKIPVVVSMGGMAASGGYYIAMAVGDQPDTIFAEPTTTTGSIGVIIPHYDLTGLMEQMKVKDDSLMSNPRKAMLSMTRPLTGENRDLVQNYLMEAFDRFKEVVREGRPQLRGEGALDAIATGEIFTAQSARKRGLVDRIGFVEDALARTAELAKLSDDDYRVVQYRKPVSLLDLSDLSSLHGQQSQLDALLDMTTPRAYYLFTSLPVLMRAE